MRTTTSTSTTPMMGIICTTEDSLTVPASPLTSRFKLSGLRELAHALLHTSGNDGFSSCDREQMASFVSSLNRCYFCQTSQGAAAAHLNGGDLSLVDWVCKDYPLRRWTGDMAAAR